MRNSFQNRMGEKVAGRLHPWQLKIELVIVFILVIGFILNTLNIENTDILLAIALSSLSTLYFILSFYRSDARSEPIQLFLHKLLYISFTIGSTALLFSFNHYPGGIIMMKTGLASIVISVLARIIIQMKNGDNISLNGPDVIRAFILLLILISFYFAL